MSAPLDDRAAMQPRGLAAQFDLEYRDAAAVSVDPRALSLLAPHECRRLRAVPLEATSTGVVVGIDSPSDECFEAVRAQTGQNTRFVLLDDRTVDALLSSRMFAATAHTPAPPRTAAVAPLSPAPPPVEEPVAPPPIAPAPVEHASAAPPPAAPPPSPPEVEVEPPREPDDAPAAATAPAEAPEEPVAWPVPEPATAGGEVAPPPAPPVEPSRSGAVDELLARIDAAVSAWSDVRAAFRALDDELEASRRHLRETKEQLAVARAQSDQDQLRINSLEAELEQGRGIVAAARRRLIDAADALADEVPEPPLHLPDHD